MARSISDRSTLDWGALVIVAVVATLIALGTKLSSKFSLVVTAIKVAVVVLVVVVGAFYVKAANYSPFIPPREAGDAGGGVDQSVLSLLTGAHGSHYGWYGVLAGASIVFFAFIGFDIVATIAEETKNPQRDVPRGILASLAIVTVLYVAVSVVLSGMVSYTQLKTAPDGHHANLATAFAANGVQWASGIISVGALAGLTTVVMVLLLGDAGCCSPWPATGYSRGRWPRPVRTAPRYGSPCWSRCWPAPLPRRFRRTSSRKWSTSAPCSRSYWCPPASSCCDAPVRTCRADFARRWCRCCRSPRWARVSG